jgi:polyhydroxyalkanoate synthesis regulator phasin
MENPIRTGIYAGLGLALRTRDAVMETGRRIAQESSMSEDEGRKFVDDLLKQSEDVRGRLSELVEERVSDVLNRFDLAKRSDIDRLEQRIAELESKSQQKQQTH